MAMASKRNEPQTASVHDVGDLVFNSPALVVSFCKLRSKTKSEPFMLYRSLLRPLLFRLPPETAHELALNSLSFAPGFITFVLGNRFKRSPFGNLRRFGLKFSNPVGLAAGFNNEGAKAFAKRVERERPDCVLGVSIGKSKIVAFEDAVADYLQSFAAV